MTGEVSLQAVVQGRVQGVSFRYFVVRRALRLAHASGRPDEALVFWRRSWPMVVATDGEKVIGFVRGLADGEVTTYVAEFLVDPHYRGQDIGIALLDACHHLYPHTRLDLLATESSDAFYEANGFRRFQGFRKSSR